MNATKKETNTLQRNTIATAYYVGATLDKVEVSPRFAPHYFNIASGKHGLDNIIIAILQDPRNNATNQQGIENTNRQQAMSRSMTADAVFAIVQMVYAKGQGRYKMQAVKNSLSTYLKGKVCKFRMTPNEDCTGKPPRTRYYLPV